MGRGHVVAGSGDGATVSRCLGEESDDVMAVDACISGNALVSVIEGVQRRARLTVSLVTVFLIVESN